MELKENVKLFDEKRKAIETIDSEIASIQEKYNAEISESHSF